MLHSFLKSCPFAIAQVAPDGLFLAASPAFPKMLGLTMAEFLRTNYRDITHPDDLALDIEQHQALLDGRVDSYNMRKRYRHKDGGWFWVLLEVGVDRTSSHAWAYVSKLPSTLPEFGHLEMYNAVERALRRAEFTLEYQPIVNLETRKTVAYEALIRWAVDGRSIGPDDWLPDLDASIFPQVDRWVFRQVCIDRLRWDGPENIAFAANLSPVSLGVDGFIESILDIPTEIGVPRCQIWVEFTEQAGHPSNVAMLIKMLQVLGHRVAIDDFGVGASNLAALATYGADVVKIDKSIVRELPSYSAVQIINMLSATARSTVLPFRLVCEGLEDEYTARLVQALGVDYGQGWLFGKPMPLECWQ